MEVSIEEKVVSSDPPPAYCTLALVANESCSNTNTTPEVVVSDVDEEPLVGGTFLNKTARIGFIQKVLAVRFLQVFASFVIILAATLCWYNEPYAYFREFRSKLMMLSSLLHMATIIPLFCFKHEATLRPFNIMFLVAYPLTTTFVLIVITSWYLHVSVEFCLAWYCYMIMLLGQLILSLFCLHTSLEYRMRSAMLLAAVLTILTFGFTGPFTSYLGHYDWDFSMPWLCFLTLLMFVECAQTQYQLSVMTSEEHPRLNPADFLTGTLYTYMIFGYNYPKYVKRFAAKGCRCFE